MSKAKAGGEQPVEIPDTLPILPLRNSVLFPGAIIPIDVGRRKSVRLVEDAIAKERPVIGILTQKDARTEDPGSGDLYMIGCAARILKVIKLAKDNFSVILQGVSRFEVSAFDGAEPFLAAKVRSVPDPTSSDVELDALVMNLKDIAKRVVKLMPELPKEAGALVDSVTEAGHLADLITSNLELEVSEKQDVLETFDLKGRTRKVLQFLSRQLEVLKVRERINTQVQEEMGRNQREYVLRQQLKAIKEELGELDEAGGDLDEFKDKISAAKMPAEVRSDGPQPARVRPPPAAQGDQGGARRARRGRRRPRRVQGQDQRRQDAGRGPIGWAATSASTSSASSSRRSRRSSASSTRPAATSTSSRTRSAPPRCRPRSDRMGRNQREYVLRQQLKAIKEELGELDEAGGDLDEFKDKISAAKMPAEV